MRKILGAVAILDKGHRAAPQACDVLLGEPLESNRLAGPSTFDQLAFVVFVCVHRNRDSHVADKRFTRQYIFVQTLLHATATADRI
ncbi:MAG: hypothetical protein ACLQVF_28325 [Isosphaeraceae bacterium]